jgi:hypothetical protein
MRVQHSGQEKHRPVSHTVAVSFHVRGLFVIRLKRHQLIDSGWGARSSHFVPLDVGQDREIRPLFVVATGVNVSDF